MLLELLDLLPILFLELGPQLDLFVQQFDDVLIVKHGLELFLFLGQVLLLIIARLVLGV